MQLKDAFILEHNDLAEGETRAGQTCPHCEGGSDGKRTLSISRANGILLWHCHRDSCTFSGRYGGRLGIAAPKKKQARGMVGRTFARSAEAVPEKEREWLSSRLRLTPQHIARAQLGWDARSDRLVQPVFTYDEEVAGCCLRALDGREPKSLSHTEPDAMAWYRNRESDDLIIVEDIFSAIRASSYMNSVALLSTHMNDVRVAQIREAGFDKAFIALDKDAYSKSIQYTILFRGQLRLIPVHLDRDIKDMTDEEADDLFDNMR